MNILSKADDLVSGDRNKDYGDPLQDFTRIAAMWSTIFSIHVTPEQVPLCMIALKISRECHKHKEDNLIDIAGYAQVLDTMMKEATHEKVGGNL